MSLIATTRNLPGSLADPCPAHGPIPWNMPAQENEEDVAAVDPGSWRRCARFPVSDPVFIVHRSRRRFWAGDRLIAGRGDCFEPGLERSAGLHIDPVSGSHGQPEKGVFALLPPVHQHEPWGHSRGLETPLVKIGETHEKNCHTDVIGCPSEHPGL